MLVIIKNKTIRIFLLNFKIIIHNQSFICFCFFLIYKGLQFCLHEALWREDAEFGSFIDFKNFWKARKIKKS